MVIINDHLYPNPCHYRSKLFLLILTLSQHICINIKYKYPSLLPEVMAYNTTLLSFYTFQAWFLISRLLKFEFWYWDWNWDFWHFCLDIETGIKTFKSWVLVLRLKSRHLISQSWYLDWYRGSRNRGDPCDRDSCESHCSSLAPIRTRQESQCLPYAGFSPTHFLSSLGNVGFIAKRTDEILTIDWHFIECILLIRFVPNFVLG